jgi:dTDP-glucose 4,6-dehydratase
VNVLVAGGAGMIGSELCTALVARGDHVVCVDDFSTGRLENLDHLVGDDAFAVVGADVSEPGLGARIPGRRYDVVVNLASAASPIDFVVRPLEILRAGAEGTRQLLEVAGRDRARFVMASTSEVYGDPDRSPQSEDYVGRVDTMGPRAVYDEAKRFAEALTAAHHRHLGTNVGIARIFNTYGPRARDDDGRAVPTFVRRALDGGTLEIFGDGRATRSFCYVDDLVAGLTSLIDSDFPSPVNLGNPEEISVDELVVKVATATGRQPRVRYLAGRPGDPTRRCPDISLARRELGFAPTVGIDEGLARYVATRTELDVRPALSAS